MGKPPNRLLTAVLDLFKIMLYKSLKTKEVYDKLLLLMMWLRFVKFYYQTNVNKVKKNKNRFINKYSPGPGIRRMAS